MKTTELQKLLSLNTNELKKYLARIGRKKLKEIYSDPVAFKALYPFMNHERKLKGGKTFFHDYENKRITDILVFLKRKNLIDLNILDYCGHPIFFYHFDKRILKYVNVNYEAECGMNILTENIITLKGLKVLLKLGFNINHRERNWDRSFLDRVDDINIIRFALKNGFKPKSRNLDNDTIFHRSNGYTPKCFIKEGLKYGIVDFTVNDCSEILSTSILRTFVKNNIKIFENKKGKNHFDYRITDNSMLRFLIKQGIDLNDKYDGNSIFSDCYMNFETFKEAVKRGLPLKYYFYFNFDAESLQFAIDNGFNINTLDKNKNTVLYYCSNVTDEMLKIAIDNGLDLNLKNKDGEKSY